MNATNNLGGFNAKRLYLYLSRRAQGKSGYYEITYADMAQSAGFDWCDPARRANAVAWIDAALDRLARCKLIYLRPSPSLGCVQVWMSTNPKKITAQYGGLYLDRLLGVNQAVDPWDVA